MKPAPGTGQVHLFRFPSHGDARNSAMFAYDVGSGALVKIDEVLWEGLSIVDPAGGADLAAAPDAALAAVRGLGSDRFPAAGEAEDLIEAGLLFSPVPEPPVLGSPPLKALCLNVTHACNLKCAYCFAHGVVNRNGAPTSMSPSVARAAIDMLLDACGDRKQVEVDFFGGEPLLAFDVVKHTVEYAAASAAAKGKIMRFAITTNGLLLDDGALRFIKDHGIFVVASLDGRPEVHDSCRRMPSGEGSYDAVLPAIAEMADKLEGTLPEKPREGEGRLGDSYHGLQYFVRGTFTRNNLDFAEDVFHLAKLGFRNLSLEPAVLGPEHPLSIREQDLERAYRQYELIAAERSRGMKFNFFHFLVDPEGGPCLGKRTRGCGAGQEYLAVDPAGNLYPCHQLVGKEEFRLGTVSEGITKPDICERFGAVNVFTRTSCATCWARFHCSGGCRASSYLLTGRIDGLDDVSCRLERKRFECALFLLAHARLDSTHNLLLVE